MDFTKQKALNHEMDVVEGKIPGREVMSILGANVAASSTLQDIWDPGGTLVYPTAGETWEVVSSDAADTSAGTGARTVLIQYLDDNYISQEEIVTMNGTTPVATSATDAFRFRRALVLTGGSSDTNEGNITIRVVSAGAIRGQIKIGNGNSLDGHFTVEADKAAYLRFVYCNINKNEDAEIILRSSVGTGKIFSIRFPLSVYQNTVVSPVELPARFSEKSDLKLTVVSTNPNTKVFVALQFEVVDEPGQPIQQDF